MANHYRAYIVADLVRSPRPFLMARLGLSAASNPEHTCEETADGFVHTLLWDDLAGCTLHSKRGELSPRDVMRLYYEIRAELEELEVELSEGVLH